mmetsp:Transcript_27946/g.56272  ORF Transcript_27946/g.56272 Transcript_27946/m.56272 type:complete len:125 (-) Transcript_27946:257-631(-)
MITLCEFMTLSAARFELFLEAHPQVRTSLVKFSTTKSMSESKKAWRVAHLASVQVELRQQWHVLQPSTRSMVVDLLDELADRISAMGTLSASMLLRRIKSGSFGRSSSFRKSPKVSPKRSAAPS